MRAIVYQQYGPPEVLHIDELPSPEPKANEVKIEVHAAEATKADCELRSFRFPVKWFWLPLRLAMGIRRPKRPILGGYFSGEVVSKGSSVDAFEIGQKVFGSSQLKLGAYGQYLSLPADYTIASMPSNLSYVEAAAVPLGGLNALHFMRLANLQPNERILINGAGGSIGIFAIQIAKSQRAHVTAVDAGHKEGLLKDLGIDRFIDYRQQSFWDDRQSYDAILDIVAGNSYSKSMDTLAKRGRYLTANPRLSVMLRSFATTALTKKSARFAFAGETLEELNTLRDMIENGVIRPVVDRVFPMEQAPEAHHRVESERRIGGVVISIGSAPKPTAAKA